jgi:NADPH:quinone reductase-like Zn-dependent oxidoreductase
MLEARDLPHVVQSTIGEEYTTDSAQHIIKRILELAFFKSPGLKILHIIQSVNDPTKTILDELFPRESSNSNSLQCDEYVLADASEGTSTPEAKMYERVIIVEWKNISSERAGYDIVLVPCSVREDTLPRLFSLIKKGGRALLFNPDKCNHQRHDLRENSILPFESGVNGAIANVQVRESALIEIGFASVISVPCMKPNESPLVIAEKPFHRSASDAMNLVLVMDCTSMYQQALADHLRSQRSMNIQTQSVEDLAKTDSKHLHPETVYVFLYEIEKPLLASLSQETFYALRKILLLATRILWITSRDQNGVLNPDFAMIDGLARVIRSENHNTTVMTARLEWNTPEHQASMIMRLIRNTDFGIAGQDYESEYSVVDGTVCVQRVYPAKSLSQEISDGREFSTSNTMERAFGAGPPLKMVVGTPGLLDSLHFVEDISTKDPIAGDEVEIKVHAAGLNFKDLLIALGRVEGTGIGIECAGTIARCGEHVDGLVPGDRVICLCNAAFSTYVRAKGASLARLPPGPSMEHAAAIPVQFGTAYYAIHVMAKLQRGETILIHSGAGGTGQASIQIAQHLGGEVFVTVSSNGKKELLMVRYGIPESHIFYSRDASFAEGILQVTNGRGVDVVLNSLAGESLLASWDVIAPYGRFIELGKKDINQNSSLPMRPFSRGASFMHLETTAITADNPELVRNVLDELLALFAEQKLQPVHQLQTFPISDLQKGLQILQSGNSIGKLAFQMDDGAMVKVRLDKTIWSTSLRFLWLTITQTRLSGFQQARLNPEKTYVIAGGTGGLGLATAIWMVKKKGARNLLLLSRSGLRNPAAMNAVEDLRREGANVEAPECDICDDLALKSTLKSYEGVLPAFGGCIQACMVLKVRPPSLETGITHQYDPLTMMLGCYFLQSLI